MLRQKTPAEHESDTYAELTYDAAAATVKADKNEENLNVLCDKYGNFDHISLNDVDNAFEYHRQSVAAGSSDSSNSLAADVSIHCSATAYVRLKPFGKGDKKRVMLTSEHLLVCSITTKDVQLQLPLAGIVASTQQDPSTLFIWSAVASIFVKFSNKDTARAWKMSLKLSQIVIDKSGHTSAYPAMCASRRKPLPPPVLESGPVDEQVDDDSDSPYLEPINNPLGYQRHNKSFHDWSQLSHRHASPLHLDIQEIYDLLDQPGMLTPDQPLSARLCDDRNSDYLELDFQQNQTYFSTQNLHENFSEEILSEIAHLQSTTLEVENDEQQKSPSVTNIINAAEPSSSENTSQNNQKTRNEQLTREKLCAGCSEAFKAKDKICHFQAGSYHRKCFSCSACSRVLVNSFISKDETLFCSKCHDSVNLRRCSGCARPQLGESAPSQEAGQCEVRSCNCITCFICEGQLCENDCPRYSTDSQGEMVCVNVEIGHICFKCDTPILDTQLRTHEERYWHNTCLTCHHCTAPLLFDMFRFTPRGLACQPCSRNVCSESSETKQFELEHLPDKW